MTESHSIIRILADVHIPLAIIEQLRKRGVIVERVPDLLGQDAPDTDILEYAFVHGYAILTHDKKMQTHVNDRVADGKEYCGVFIIVEHLQGSKGIGQIVEHIALWHEAIMNDAANLQDEVYNRVNWIS